MVRVSSLGEAAVPSPLLKSRSTAEGSFGFVPDDVWIRYEVEFTADRPTEDELVFQKAGPRARLLFDPANVRAAIVTCGGLCPGLNDVIRSLFIELTMAYGVPEVWGIRYGYQGLNPQVGIPPVRLTADMVEGIHRAGGTVLGSSRGEQDPAVIVDFLVSRRIDLLFCVGGDGTFRGAQAIFEEVQRRGLRIAVVGIPKTIDNDIPYCDVSFGVVTAVAEAQRVLDCAHVEANGSPYGIGLVKLMGRGAGFITALATLGSQDVNFALVPEVPFALHGPCGFLDALHKRMLARRHALIAVAEGAGQDLFPQHETQRDASGNVKLDDIGLLLKREIMAYFAERGPKVDVKYIDPSYIIRSVPANTDDSIFCDQFARHAVHAAMAGMTGVFVGHMSTKHVYVPIAMATDHKRAMSVTGGLWRAVLAATGQPSRFS